jgi:hypothetical protein
VAIYNCFFCIDNDLIGKVILSGKVCGGIFAFVRTGSGKDEHL